MKKNAVFAALALLICSIYCGWLETDDVELPPLPYAYNALEPFVDEATMKVHHTGHHAAYTKNLNTALDTLRKRGKF